MPSDIEPNRPDKRPKDVPRPTDVREPPEPDVVAPPLPEPEPDLPGADDLPER